MMNRSLDGDPRLDPSSKTNEIDGGSIDFFKNFALVMESVMLNPKIIDRMADEVNKRQKNDGDQKILSADYLPEIEMNSGANLTCVNDVVDDGLMAARVLKVIDEGEKESNVKNSKNSTFRVPSNLEEFSKMGKIIDGSEDLFMMEDANSDSDDEDLMAGGGGKAGAGASKTRVRKNPSDGGDDVASPVADVARAGLTRDEARVDCPRSDVARAEVVEEMDGVRARVCGGVEAEKTNVQTLARDDVASIGGLKNCGNSNNGDKNDEGKKNDENVVKSSLVNPKISYASMVDKRNKEIKNCIASLGCLPEPIIRGEKTLIEIPDNVYDDCIAKAKNDLIGRIQYKKGDKPFLLKDVKEKLQNIWNLKLGWKIAPIGRGFFYCRFESEEDKNLAWTKGLVRLNPGIFKLMKWVPNFNPFNYQSSLVNVWIKIIGLSGELFQPEIMLRVAKGVGTPISIDKVSANLELAHFARVLVEVDVAQNLPYSITICAKGIEYEIEIQYENLPYFCDHCSLNGHSKYDCRKLRKSIEEREERREKVVKNTRARSRSRTKQFHARNDNIEVENHARGNEWVVKNSRKNKGAAHDNNNIEVEAHAKKNDMVANQKSKGAAHDNNVKGNIKLSNNFDCLNMEDDFDDNYNNLPKNKNNIIGTSMGVHKNGGAKKVVGDGSVVGDLYKVDNNVKNLNFANVAKIIDNQIATPIANPSVAFDSPILNLVNPFLSHIGKNIMINEVGKVDKNFEDNEVEVVKESSDLGVNRLLDDSLSISSPSLWGDEVDKELEEKESLIKKCLENKLELVTSSLIDSNDGETDLEFPIVSSPKPNRKNIKKKDKNGNSIGPYSNTRSKSK